VYLVVGATALHAQVRLEERHLLARHGQAYRAYCREAPRWLWPSPRWLRRRATLPSDSRTSALID
jgi:protein-S-isoprenylcysteine O-methyltransferase Ste14